MTVAHPEFLWILIVSGITCAFLAISIGSNDVANAFSTSLGSGTLTLRAAIVIAVIFEFIGSISLGGRVSDAIRTRVLNFDAFSDSPHELALGMLCSSVGSTLWLVFTTYFGLPVSTTHSIIGALAGFGVASGRLNGVRWVQVLYIVISWFVVPLFSILISCLIYLCIQELVLRRKNPYKLMLRFHWLFLILFAIPLSVFIAFENSLLRSTPGAVPDAYRRWFEASNTNKFISVLIILAVLVALSCIVTYTVIYLRMKSGWTFCRSPSDIDPIFSATPRSKNKDRKPLADEPSEAPEGRVPADPGLSEYIKQNFNADQAGGSSSSHKGGDSDAYTGDETSFTYAEALRAASAGPAGAAEPSGGAEHARPGEAPKKSVSRSIVDALLSKVGVGQTPREPPPEEPRDRRSSEEASLDADAQHSGTRLDRMLRNIRKSYARPAQRARKPGPASDGLPETARQGDDSGLSETMLKTHVVFSAMQIVGATVAIISHSANDTANAVSPFATVYFLYFDGLRQSSKTTPWYILLSGGFFMSLGLALFGYKVIKTVGLNITRVTPSRGYTIDSTAGVIVLMISHLGIPLSSTHVTVSSILGIGMIKQLPATEHLSPRRPESARAGADKRALGDTADPQSVDAESQRGAPLAGQSALEREFSLEREARAKPGGLAARFTLEHVNLKLYCKIFLTWIITIFSSGILTAILFLISKLIYKLAT